MAATDPRIDAYIRKAAPFAQPILVHLRELLHECCPEVVETIKWGMPAFEYHGPMCGLAAFKRHCALGFWKRDLVAGDDARAKTAMGSFGRITTLDELPSKTALRRYIRRAMRLNEQGVKVPRKAKGTKPPVPMHADLRRALLRNKRAAAALAGMSPSHQREYLEWIAEAKRDETRARRIAKAVEWLAQGKTRNWQYR